MSNFLELINDVARESGTMGGRSLTTIASASGRWAKVVAWTRQAWEMIQRERPDWTFLRVGFEGTLTAGMPRYSPVDLGIIDFGGWEREADGYVPYSLYDPAIGRADESHLVIWNWRDWESRFDFGVHDAARPRVVAFDAERLLCLGATPDKAYRLRGRYRRAIQSLTLDSDVPYIAANYHQAIVWRALMLLGEDDESQFEAGTSAAQYAFIRSAMVREYTDGIEI